ncbi:hypothetical protein [Natronomonas gomsonensis]|uniref:hypothetical protein n=1 Tax=Natronomonas gomsonensis TaxID=1046043 RepID=UPI0015BD8DA0|nr:hypothetical protein [Natronomonas gomsonensis]
MAGREASAGALSMLDSVVRGTGRRLAAAVPWLDGPLAELRGRYAHLWLRYAQWRHGRRHTAPIDPYRIAWVDPDRIEYVTEPPELPRFRWAGSVMDGDWDRSGRRFVDTDVYRAFEAHFQRDLEWSETAFFDRVLEEIRRGEQPWGCDSRAALERRLRNLDRLYERVAADGFRTQRELAADSAYDDPVGSRRRSVYDRLINDEMAIDIGRDGELLFADGRNRLSIAKVLGVDRVPVVILRRHEAWVAFRDRVADHVAETGVLPSAVADHPDLKQLEES